MDINTLQFWQKVKKEYNPDSIYICHSSDTFEEAWRCAWGKKEISNLAQQFLNICDTDYAIGFIYLFTFPAAGCERTANLRIEFIDWCIKKFKK